MSSPSRPVTKLNKSAVLDALFDEWNAIDGLLAPLTDDQWQASTPLPGWNVHDVVAHVIGTESMLQGIATPDAGVDVSTFDHVRNDIGVMNERWVRKLGASTPSEVLEQFRSITAERRKTLSDMDDGAWDDVTVTPAGPDSYGRFMRVRIFDCWMHEHDIRDAVGPAVSADELHCFASEFAISEMVASMGFVVGKLGGAPNGSRVAIELTGPLSRTINVAIQGRGQLVDDFGEDGPTATIRLDGLLFAKLAGGRVPLAQHTGEIAYGGDESVGTRIVEHLNYVI